MERHGETSLYFAARGNHTETLDTLLQMSANPTLEASKEIGSLYAVVKKFESEELQRLLYLWYVNNKVSLPPEMEQDLEHLQNLVKNHPPPSSTSSTSSSIPNSTSSSNLAHSSPSLSSSQSTPSSNSKESDRLTNSHPLPISQPHPVPFIDVEDVTDKKKPKKKDRLKKQQVPKSPKGFLSLFPLPLFLLPLFPFHYPLPLPFPLPFPFLFSSLLLSSDRFSLYPLLCCTYFLFY